MKWEYKLVEAPDEKVLNALGADGWEFVDVFARDMALFKRPKATARREAEEEVLLKVYSEAFQRGVERGRLEERKDRQEAECKPNN